MNSNSSTQQYNYPLKVDPNNKKEYYTEIYVWGNDEYGQLGLGHRYHTSEKQKESVK